MNAHPELMMGESVPRLPKPFARLPGPRARLIAFSLYDFADSAFATIIVTVLFSQYYAGAVAGGAVGVSILGRQVPGATVFAWMDSVSMAMVALAAPFLGVLSDRRGSRIGTLGLFLVPGVLLTLSLATVGPGQWLRGGLLFVGAYACFGGASVFYNALLPEVGPAERMGRNSGIAWGTGYLGGALILILSLVMLRNPGLLGFSSGTFSIRSCFAAAGWWWLLFSLPLLWVFRYEARRKHTATATSLGHEVAATVRQVVHTLRELSRTRNLLRYFLAFLLYNDGVQTVVAMASIFGAQELGMPADQLILFFLMIQGTAFLGSMLLGWLADRGGHKRTLLLCVAAWFVFTLWASFVGILGAALREWWILGGLAGLFLGGIQSCSRSMLVQWIPEGRESELFGFFAIMSRAASIFGPLVYGGVVLATGSMRRGILSVAFFFLAGGIALLTVRPSEIEGERQALAR